MYFYAWIALAGYFVLMIIYSSIETRYYFYVTLPLLLLVCYFLLRTIIRTILVERYIRKFPNSQLFKSPSGIDGSSIDLELNKIDSLKPIAVDGNTRAFLATFRFYTRTKYGDFLAKEAYYHVFETQLERRLPHIVFDSKTAKGRQFKSLYLEAQRISIQGSFDDVFDAYVPQDYAIDSLSFVTPEVMQLLIDAKSCDIEIANDKLLLFAPLLSDNTINDFIKSGKAIADALNDNIDTYRDNRLKGEQRKTDVTFFARTLLRSPTKYLIFASLLGLAIMMILVGVFFIQEDLRNDLLFNEVSIIIYIFFASNAWKASTIIRENRKAMRAYHILHHTDRGKPLPPRSNTSGKTF